jgi:glucose/arabinose dehydrogenase
MTAWWSLLFASLAVAQSCPGYSVPSTGAPKVAKGFTANVILRGLTKPRGMVVDPQGNLLVVESGKGVSAYTVKDGANGCVSLGPRVSIVGDTTVSIASDVHSRSDRVTQVLKADNFCQAKSWSPSLG